MPQGAQGWGRQAARIPAFALAAALVLATFAGSAGAIDWTGATNTWWNVATNWNPAHVPIAGENVTVRITGESDYTISYRNLVNPNDVLGNLTIEGMDAGYAIVQGIEFCNLRTASIYLGNTGKGKARQATGIWSTTGILYMGYMAGSDGRYNMEGGILNTGSSIYLGNAGTGIFTQTAGTVTTGLNLRLGVNSTGVGQYTLQGGTLNSGDQLSDTVYVGQSGQGTFNHDGGTHHIFGDMRIGDTSTGVGTYTINGSAGMVEAPALDMQNLIVGVAGEGTFTINNAGVTVRGNLTVGQSATGDGTVNVTATGGPSSLSIGGSVSIGAAGDGKMTITGSTVNVAGALTVGPNGLFKVSTGGVPTISGNVVVDGSAATLMIQAGFMTSQGVGTAPVVIADAGYGVVRHTGGTHVVTGDMTIGKLAGSIGEYTIDQTTGSSLLQAHHLFVGKAGNGTLRQDAGNMDLSGSLYVGNSTGGVGNATFAGGTCDITGSAWVGGQGAGEMTVSGNSAVTVAGNVNLGADAGSSGALTLSGGTLSVGGYIAGGVGTSSFTYGGGTLSLASHNLQVGEINVKGGQGVTWTTGDNIACQTLFIGHGVAGKLVTADGILNVTHSVWVDYSGAWVVQGASDVNITNNANLVYGSALLKGGTVDVGGNMSVEDAVVTHTNSAVNIVGDLWIGSSAMSAYTLLDDVTLFSPLTLACQNMKVGVNSTGLYSQDGGSTTVRGDLVVGQGAGSEGTLEFREAHILRNTVLTVQGNTQVGLSGSGEVKIYDDPTLTMQGNLDIGGPDTGYMLIDGPATVQVNGNTAVNGTGFSLLRLNDGTLTSGQNTGQTLAVGKANLGAVEHNGGTLTVRGDLILGQLAGGLGSYTMDETEGPAHLEARHLYAGKEGNGTFSQLHGDTDLSGSLYIGHAATSTNGQYNISGGTFDVAGSAWVGVQGAGAFTIFSGATVTIGQDINLADAAGASGTLTLAGGSLSVGHWIYGGQATSIFAYKGGTLSVAAHQISVGEIRVSGGSGVTWTTADSISASNLRVGYQQAGRMVQTGGTLNVTQDLSVGWTGSDYVLQAGDANVMRDLLVTAGKAEIKAGTLDIGRNMTLAMAFDTTGDVEQTGGTVTLLGDMAVGTLGGMATYTLKGGTLNSGNLSPDCTYIGKDAQSIGFFDHRGGVHNVGYDFKLGLSGTARGAYVMTDDPTLAGSPSLTGLYADIGYGATGTYEQSGGTTHFVLNANVGRLAGSSGLIGVYGGDFTVDGALLVGRAGAGTLRQTGGFIGVGGELAFAYDAGSTATWTLSDDPAVAGTPGLETAAQNIGRSGAAVVTQSGGNNYSAATITLGYNAGSSGIYNLSGGTMHADDAIVVGRAGHGELLITGGTADSSGNLSVGSAGGTGLVRLEAAGTLHINGQFLGYMGSTFIYNGGVYTDTSNTLMVNEFVLADGAGTRANWALGAGDALNTSAVCVGRGGTATLTVTGGSVLTESQLTVAEGGTGTLTVRSGSTVTLADTLDMCRLPGSTGLIDVRDSTLWVGGEAQLGQGATIKVGSAANVSIGAAVLNPGSLVRIAGGTLTFPNASALTLNGGGVAFDAGSLVLAGDSDLDGGFVGTVFGPGHDILSGQNLQVQGLASLQARLGLNGGRLSVQSLASNGCLDFQRGTLEVLGQFVFGDAGPLGRTVVLGASQTAAGQFGATIDAGASVTLAGGQISPGTTSLDVSGELAGSGTVTGGLHVWESGELRIGAGETLRFLAGMYSSYSMNNGSIRLTGGTFEASGSLMNQTGAMISGRGTLIAEGGHQNFGAMTFSSGPTDVYGDVTNYGIVVSTGGATVTFFDDVDNSGEIRTSTGCATVFLGALTGGGSYTGIGTVYIEGDLRPGHSPAEVEFMGDVFFGPSATVVAELGGNVRGSQYDAMVFGADAALAGDLDVTLLGGFVPRAGQTFDIFDWTTLDGTFDSVTLPDLPAGLSWDSADLYSGGSITVMPEPATLALLAAGALAMLRRKTR